MNSGPILLNIFALIILIVLCSVFFSKEKINSYESKLYALLLITMFITILFGNLSGIMLFSKTLILMYFSKIYLLGLIMMISIFALYTFTLSQPKKNKKLNYLNLLALSCIVNAVIIIALPLEMQINDGIVVPSGTALNYTLAVFSIIYLFLVILVISDFKNLNNKKYIPIIFLIVEGIIITIIQILFPKVNYIINPSSVVTCLIMYFTIENPDVKMLEEFRKNRENTEAMNREKEIFLFNLTQDIRKPLHNIGEACGKLSLMTNDKEIKKGVDYINYNDREAINIINNVLDINSMNASKIKIYNAKYNPKTLLENIAYMSKKEIPEKVDFRVNIDKSIPDSLYGDQIRIKQVIKILIENACAHTKEGFIEIEAHEISKNDICRLVISVEDSGEGILAEKVNEIFSREDINNEIDDNAHKLSTAKSISIVLGGMLMCTSEIGKGSKFTLILDQRKDETKTKELERIEEYIDKVTAIVVSENKEYLEKVTNKLIKNNIDAVGTDLGAKAIEKIRKNPNYDYIILDEELEILNVDEILRKLREIKDFNSKVIVITKDMESERYIKTGFNGIISRKISVKDIDTLNK